MPTKAIFEKKNVLVTGGAGFIGSHLCDELIKKSKVICIDNFISGDEANIDHLLQNPDFQFIKQDVNEVINLEALPELEKTLDIKIIAVTSPQLFEELRKTNPKKAQSILPDDERPLVITLHNGWPGFLHPFMLPADYSNRALGISDYLKSGNPKEVYELAKMTAGDIKEKILKAI